jgi:hypothetical protein
MFRNWLAHATGVPATPATGDRRIRTPEEETRMLSSTVEAYERELKEAARKDALTGTAKRMLARGMPVEEVVAVTELPRAEVERLADEDEEDSKAGDNTGAK